MYDYVFSLLYEEFHFRLELLPPNEEFRRCAASLRINNTLAMSGEQMASTPTQTRSNSWLHLAGIPPQFLVPNEAPLTMGFTGCMQSLQVPLGITPENKQIPFYGTILRGTNKKSKHGRFTCNKK